MARRYVLVWNDPEPRHPGKPQDQEVVGTFNDLLEIRNAVHMHMALTYDDSLGLWTNVVYEEEDQGWYSIRSPGIQDGSGEYAYYETMRWPALPDHRFDDEWYLRASEDGELDLR